MEGKTIRKGKDRQNRENDTAVAKEAIENRIKRIGMPFLGRQRNIDRLVVVRSGEKWNKHDLHLSIEINNHTNCHCALKFSV